MAAVRREEADPRLETLFAQPIGCRRSWLWGAYRSPPPSRPPQPESRSWRAATSPEQGSPVCSACTARGMLGHMELPESARRLLESDALAHLVTLNPDGSPQVTCVWVGLDEDEIVSGHLGQWRKLQNVTRDPRVSVSIEGTEIQPPGLKQYLVVHGRARVVDGGAPELLQRLAHVYLGPDVRFPPMDDPPPGHVLRITVERIGGVGPWAS